MTQRQIIGVVLITLGVGALSYLYNGYYKAYQEIKAEKNQGTTKA